MYTMYCQYCRIDHNSMNTVSQAFGINTCNKITVVFWIEYFDIKGWNINLSKLKHELRLRLEFC